MRHACWAHQVPGTTSSTFVLGARRQDWFALERGADGLRRLLAAPIVPLALGEWLVTDVGLPHVV